ncbi:MAG: VTT domain-containing protein [Acidobacteria bacterium]|nr:VTT domain-containing protein [Acidobacteriota bacterium]
MNFVASCAAGLVLVGFGFFVSLGGPGLILVGIIDQSLIPVPGGIDALTIVLAAGHASTWPVYAALATLGTLLGAALTYELSRKGGKETLEKKLPRRQIKKIESKFSQHGFSAIFIPCLLPPPLPAVPFLVGAGALQYPRRKFLIATASGRGIRYLIIAWLGHHFGDPILGFFKRYEVDIIIAFAVLIVGASAGGYLLRKWQKHKEAEEDRRAGGEQPRQKKAS